MSFDIDKKKNFYDPLEDIDINIIKYILIILTKDHIYVLVLTSKHTDINEISDSKNIINKTQPKLPLLYTIYSYE